MENYRCAIIGQHPMRFPWGFDEEDTQCRRMKLELAQCIMELRQCGVTDFQVACDPGVGLYVGGLHRPFLCRLSGDTQRTAYGLSADRQAV